MGLVPNYPHHLPKYSAISMYACHCVLALSLIIRTYIKSALVRGTKSVDDTQSEVVDGPVDTQETMGLIDELVRQI